MRLVHCPHYFYVDHHALLNLVNKPFNMRCLVWWFVIPLKFDLIVIVRLVISHKQVDRLTCITTKEFQIGLKGDLLDAIFLMVEIAPRREKPAFRVLSIDLLLILET